MSKAGCAVTLLVACVALGLLLVMGIFAGDFLNSDFGCTYSPEGCPPNPWREARELIVGTAAFAVFAVLAGGLLIIARMPEKSAGNRDDRAGGDAG